MRASMLLLWALFTATLLCGCGEGYTPPRRVVTTRGAAIVLSRDQRIAVATNRTAGVVTVFRLEPRNPPERVVLGSHEIDVRPDAEPWAAVIGANDDSAYVVLRQQQQVIRIEDLHGAPRITGRVAVGSEPTAIAISPSGARLWVANWAEGTVSIITTRDFVTQAALNLNRSLAETVVLGYVDAGRTGLAHPRALAMTDDGDDDDEDETLYATEFFSQPLNGPSAPESDSVFDRNRQGFVYPISMDTGAVAEPIALPPTETGILDGDGQNTSCFANQLYSAAVEGGRLFVTSLCTSPSGPTGPGTVNRDGNFQTLLQPTIYSVDLADPSNPVQVSVLTKLLVQHYAEDPPDDQPNRQPLIPNDIVFGRPSAGLSHAYVSAFGADAVFRVDFDARGAAVQVGSPGARFIGLHAQQSGRLPIGIALARDAPNPFALVLNDNSENLSIVELSAESVVANVSAASKLRGDAFKDSPRNVGRNLFATGLRGWSLNGEAWSSCESCHPDGLSDGVTWFFPRGPRRTISTAGTYTRDQRRILTWTANVDEVHDIEQVVRGISGGVGGILWSYTQGTPSANCRLLYSGEGCAATNGCGVALPSTCLPGPKTTGTLRNGLNGSLAELVGGGVCLPNDATCDWSAVSDWAAIDAYIRSLRAPRAARSALPEDRIAEGAWLFREGGCGACHSGPGFTLSRVFYQPGADASGALAFSGGDAPIELGSLRRKTYSVRPELRRLNPPGASGEAFYRRWEPPADDALNLAAQAYRFSTDIDDQLNCALRDVGTFPAQDGATANLTGKSVPGAPRVLEARRDATTQTKKLAEGATGFNIPSLLGLGLGGPYFHAGNARSLEEIFSSAFEGHFRAMNEQFLVNPGTFHRDVGSLIAYLLSIDDETPESSIEPGFDLCALYASPDPGAH